MATSIWGQDLQIDSVSAAVTYTDSASGPSWNTSTSAVAQGSTEVTQLHFVTQTDGAALQIPFFGKF